MKRMRCWTRILWYAGVFWLLCGLFTKGDVVRAVFRDTLTECFIAVLPVLFPYMVLSRLIVSLDLFSPLVRILRLDTRLSLPGPFPVVWLLGNLCGYPVGAAECAALVRRGNLDAKKAGILCALASHGNPVYIVQVAGVLCWNSALFGWLLFAAQFLFTAALTVFVWIRWRKGASPLTADTVSLAHSECTGVLSALSSALGDSAAACVSICGTVIFYSLLIALLPVMPIWSSAMLSAILEFTSGVSRGAAYGGIYGALITGFALGFGGLSVLTQIADRLRGTGISMRYTVLCKLCDGVWMAFAAAILWIILPHGAETTLVETAAHPFPVWLPFIGWAIFTPGLIIWVLALWKKKEICTPQR